MGTQRKPGTFRETRKPQQSKNLQHGCKRLRTLIANAKDDPGIQATTQVDGRDRGVVLVYDESEQLVTGGGGNRTFRETKQSKTFNIAASASAPATPMQLYLRLTVAIEVFS